MSIKRTAAIWAYSQHKANDLLVLLALSDNANDEGYCWPNIDTIALKSRVSRSTAIRVLARLEESGEIIVDRNRRYGNHYLVVVGMSEDEITASLLKHFGDKAISKCQIDTNEGKVSKCHSYDTSEVSKLDTSEVSLVTLDPSKEPSSESSLSAVDTAIAGQRTRAEGVADEQPTETPAVKAPKKKREPRTQRVCTLENVTPLQKVIAHHSFGVRPQQGISKQTMTRVNAILGELYTRFGKEGPDRVTPEELEATYSWHKKARGLSAPQDGVKVAGMVQERRDLVGPRYTRALPARKADPDCPICGGMGFLTEWVENGNRVIECACLKVNYEQTA